ncbi:MAG TPA: type II toxin-antitoxin system RelE/ParE family toxin [Candidatus Eisenbacteria bacterium]|nr:type II toxin-antitoxin system RelE/ParE family toxin [Candidatus Eisenbacteria bacterium]
MASYKVLIKPSAIKDLERISLPDRRRLASRLKALAETPRPAGCEKLHGKALCRIRQGDFRVIYEIADTAHVVTVFKIGHRREIYR